NAMAGSVSSGTSILRIVSYESRLRLTPASAIASCASVNSMPISFSAWCIISLVMRGAGVGDGLGEGVGDGDAVCARASNGSFDATRPAAPSAGRLLTKFRLAIFASFARGVLVFLFICFWGQMQMEMHAEITTEGIKYAGSKLKLLPHILRLAQKVQPLTVFDGFSGTTRVSQAFAQAGYRVIANDIAVWSKVFAECYLLSPHPREHYQDLIDHLNSLPGRHGWFTEHYGNSD